MGFYLSTFAWQHFVTLTVDRGVVSDWLVREYHDRFIRRVAFDAGRRVDHFFAIEFDSVSGRFAHLHAPLYGTGRLTVEGIKNRWPHGFTDVAPYDRRQHAAHYVVKGLVAHPDSYAWSTHAPPQAVEWAGFAEHDFRRAVAALNERLL